MTNPAPQFRPRRSRSGGDQSRPWIKYAALSGVAALAVVGIVLVVMFALGNGGDGDGDPLPRSTAGTAGGAEPLLEPPAYAYVVQLDDIGPTHDTGPIETYILSADGFASSGYFASISAGEQAVKEWAYLDGYQALLQPLGQAADAAQGQVYVRSESFIFGNVDGARNAFDYLVRFHEQRPGSEKVETAPLANGSAAFSLVQDTIPNTELPAVYHRFLFRRGNLVSIVQVFGALQFTSIDEARDFAVIIDEKALGQRPAPTPTPGSSNGTGSVPATATP